MIFVVAALEVSDKVQTVGAFAGFAAVLGLAVLSVLYFGQARETKRLREWAGRAPERAAEMQERVSTDAQRRVVAQPVAAQQPPRPPAAQPATPGAAAAGAAAAGATAGAKTAPAPMPAGAAAKTPPPTPGQATEVKPGGPAPVTAAGGAAPVAAPAAPTGPAAPAPAGAGGPAAPADGTDQPTVLQPAAGANSGAPPAAATPPKPPAATPPPAATKPPTPAARPQPAAPLRSARSAREAAVAPEPPASSGPAGATIAIVAAVVAILIALVLVVTGVIGGDDNEPARNEIVPTVPEPSETTDEGGTTTTATPALNRGEVSVVVLNGTGVGGLAREAAAKLGDNGYRQAASGNRGDASIPRTIVYYASGQERAARDVRRVLRVGTLQRMDAGTEVVAQGFTSGGAKPDVVATLGADAAQP